MSGKKQNLSFKNSPSSSSEESDSSSYESESVLAIGAQSSSDISSDSSEPINTQIDESDLSYKAVSQIPSYEIDQEAIRKKADKIGGWGYEKQTFYSSQLKEEAHSDDEQDINEMEKEAIKLQKARAGNFKAEDFGEIEKGDRTMLDALNQELNEIDLERIHFEKINKDISGFSNQEKLKYLVSQSPELLSLLMDLQKYSKEIQERLDPKIKSLKKNKKTMNISFYLVLKAKQSGVKNHPVIDQIVKQREIIKQMKKINDRLLKQEKEIRSYNKKKITATKKTTAKTNVKSKNEKKNKKIQSEKVNKKSKKELKATTNPSSSESKSKSKSESKPKIESSSDFNSESESESEEEQFVRFSTSSSKQNNVNIKNKEIEVNPDTNREKRKLNAFNNEDGDDNGMNEENISKRSRKNSYISNQDNDDEANNYYQQIEEQIKLKKKKENKKKKKQKKKQNRRKGKTVSIIPEPDKIVKDGEKRNINYQILKNADLTKRINKKTRNPRIKRKLKYQKAMNKWKTKVGGYKKLKGSYSGESSGIKMNITRSIQFGGSRK
ncbi:something about silencing protein [Anaeramoeba flamelloides]|uniref:Something about silencing protein n=1 Tax=Anaeramoeba flamelloides TaxID=1746091 RepID=A0AAV7ZTG3_9EUKA|nr:something about silencing protein [Anaeramoeba flamelloides]